MEKTFKLNGTEYRAVKAKTSDKICKDCHYFLDNGACDLDVCPAEGLGEDLILERIRKSGVNTSSEPNADQDLAEAVSARIAAEKAIEEENAGHLRRLKELNRKLEEAREKERILLGGLNADLIRKGKLIVEIKGNPFAVTDGSPRPIAEAAVKDILDGCVWLKEGYFGNKRYEGFYQRTDCRYGYCPTFGLIVDRIELTQNALGILGERDLSKDEKEAAIYYIMNYKKTVEDTNNQ